MSEKKLTITSEFLKATELILAGENVFIHGRPGTGKSTFISLIRDSLARKKISSSVVTPTGVAALNVKGQTIHSFLWLNPYNIEEPLKPRYKFPLLKRLSHVDVIIIDEISMVRSDLFDAIDARLRELFLADEPFAGKQVVLVGDLYQLDPVVDEESDLVQDRHFIENYGAANSFVFNSKTYQKLNLKHINFTRIFRQKEADFISHLDSVRSGRESDINAALDFFNKKVVSKRPEGVISLCATKIDADIINNKKLSELPGEEYILPAITSDEETGRTDWDSKNCPAPRILRLKAGASVMITQNDEGTTRRFVNGTIGTVEEIYEKNGVPNAVKIALKDESVILERATWFKMKLDTKGRQVEDEDKYYTQFPLQLAWAATIHKAQGLTLESAFIDLGRGAFTSGQTYVALSRIRSGEGIFLKQALKPKDIILDSSVQKFFQNCKFEKF